MIIENHPSNGIRYFSLACCSVLSEDACSFLFAFPSTGIELDRRPTFLLSYDEHVRAGETRAGETAKSSNCVQAHLHDGHPLKSQVFGSTIIISEERSFSAACMPFNQTVHIDAAHTS